MTQNDKPESRIDTRSLKWQWFDESCPACGDAATVLTDSGKPNWAYDGDLVRCCGCGHWGGIICCEDDGVASINWHDPDPRCECPSCTQHYESNKKDKVIKGLVQACEAAEDVILTAGHGQSDGTRGGDVLVMIEEATEAARTPLFNRR